MMSLDTIRAMAEEAAEAALENGTEPWVPYDAGAVHRAFASNSAPSIPFLGDYIPEGWDLEETHFVDSSGFGAAGEPAMTINQFKLLILDRDRLLRCRGYGITQAGQFQVHVGEYSRPEYEDVDEDE